MKFQYIGDPAHAGDGAQVFKYTFNAEPTPKQIDAGLKLGDLVTLIFEKNGKPVEVSDPIGIRKLSGNSHFRTVDDGKYKQVGAAGQDSAAAGRAFGGRDSVG